jgi:hypothetical protein
MMTEWWDALTKLQEFLYCIAIPSTIIMLIQTVLMFIGIGGHVDTGGGGPIEGGVGHDLPHDAIVTGHSTIGHGGIIAGMHDTTSPAAHSAQGSAAQGTSSDHDDLASFHLFSFRSILAFFVVFGWVGLAMADNKTIAPAVIIIVSLLAGVAALVLTAWMFYAILKLQYSGNVVLSNAVGLEAEVYIPIPAGRSGQGKVNLLLQGRWFECDAVTTSLEPLKTRQSVKVMGLQGGSVLLVEPLDKKN